MTTSTVKLVDAQRRVVAMAQVAKEGDHFAGLIDLTDTPPDLRALFEEFEEIVNGQMFSFLDEIQGKIAARKLIVASEAEGLCGEVVDLQVYPGTGAVSFKVNRLAVDLPPQFVAPQDALNQATTP